MEAVGTLFSFIVIGVVVWKVSQTAFWKNHGQKAVSSALSSGKASLKDYQEKAAAEKARKATPEYRIPELQKQIAQLQREVKSLTRKGRSQASSAKWAGFLGGAAGREAQSKYSQAQIKQNEIMMLQAELHRLMNSDQPKQSGMTAPSVASDDQPEQNGMTAPSVASDFALAKRIASTCWRKFQALSPKGKAITVGLFLLVMALGQLFGSEEPSTSARATSTRASSTPTSSTTTTLSAGWNRMTSLNVTCMQLDGMMDQAWDLGNNALADAYESVWGKECRGRM